MRDYIVTILGVPYRMTNTTWLGARASGCRKYLREHPTSSYNITKLINAGSKKIQVRVVDDKRIKYDDMGDFKGIDDYRS